MEEFPASLAVVSASERNGARARRPAAGLRSGAIVSVTSRFDRRKPRPAEIIERKEKVQLRAVSVDFAMCQKLGAANFHGLDSSVVIRKATSQTTLLALEGPAKSCIEREVGDSHVALVQDSTRRRHWQREHTTSAPARLLGPLRLVVPRLT